jgi:hypothetical protein
VPELIARNSSPPETMSNPTPASASNFRMAPLELGISNWQRWPARNRFSGAVAADFSWRDEEFHHCRPRPGSDRILFRYLTDRFSAVATKQQCGENATSLRGFSVVRPRRPAASATQRHNFAGREQYRRLTRKSLEAVRLRIVSSVVQSRTAVASISLQIIVNKTE